MFTVVIVLNLIINGIPSILLYELDINNICCSFKPYYKWNTFNTLVLCILATSIIFSKSFKPYYKWNTFNTPLVKKSLNFGIAVGF